VWKKIYLHSNNITDEGAKSFHSLLEWLVESKKNCRFKVINLTGNRISPQMVNSFKQEFKNMVPLLDIDLQKPQEQDLQKIEDKETLKVLKSPRQKKKICTKKR